MIYETQIAFTGLDNNGNEKTMKERYIVANGESFSDVEDGLYKEFAPIYNDVDVTEIKRSKIKEIANTRQNDSELLWLAELQDTFTNDDGVEKTLKYKILFYAITFDSAKTLITEYAKQGYDLELISLKLTRFTDVLL